LGAAEGKLIGVDPKLGAREKPGQGFEKTVREVVGKGGKKPLLGGVLKLPQDPRGGMAEKGRASKLPEVDQAAAPDRIQPEIPGPAYSRQLRPQAGR
jgi:hypothetical protein